MHIMDHRSCMRGETMTLPGVDVSQPGCCCRSLVSRDGTCCRNLVFGSMGPFKVLFKKHQPGFLWGTQNKRRISLFAAKGWAKPHFECFYFTAKNLNKNITILTTYLQRRRPFLAHTGIILALLRFWPFLPLSSPLKPRLQIFQICRNWNELFSTKLTETRQCI